jgi:hypothetical protein
MLRIKWTSRPKQEQQQVPSDNRMVIIDCGRARERTKGFGGHTWESGTPPFTRTFP